MKKTPLTQRGYKKIDQISGLWKHTYVNMQGKEVVLADYAYYDIFYNEDDDIYEVEMRGFRPQQHYLNGEVVMMINFLNTKPENDFIIFSRSSTDYFLQKESLINFITAGFGEVKEVKEEPDLVVLKFGLEQDKEFIMTLRINNPIMTQVIQNFKKSLKDVVEIYEELDNILITSDGYFVCTEKSNMKKINRDDEGKD